MPEAEIVKERLEKSGYIVTIKESMSKIGNIKKYGVYADKREDLGGISHMVKESPAEYKKNVKTSLPPIGRACYKGNAIR